MTIVRFDLVLLVAFANMGETSLALAPVIRDLTVPCWLTGLLGISFL